MRKIPTLFMKDPTDLSLVLFEINPDCQWVKDGKFIATRKFDGLACAIIDGNLYKRYDVKKGKTAPLSAIPCQEPDIITGHHPHWVLCQRVLQEDKLFWEAYDNLENKVDGTYELCGEKISTERFTQNFNVEKVKGHQLIKHGSEVFEINDVSFLGIKNFLEEHDIEGIVFYHTESDKMCKIRKKDFGLKR